MQAHVIQWSADCNALVLSGTRPVQRNPQGLLWLRLPGGAVRAFRLPLSACNLAAMEGLAGQCAQDEAGKTLTFPLKWAPQAAQAVVAHALYAAPVAPTANPGALAGESAAGVAGHAAASAPD